MASISNFGPAIAGLSHDSQPIVALSSGLGAVAVIRITGDYSFDIALSILKRKEASPPKHRQLNLYQLLDPINNEVIDDPLAAFFKGPMSYTGQDTVEIFVHGGPWIVERSIGLFVAAGCRRAGPGEYTKRAFLSGKLDLTAAEGIRELVSAQSKQEWQAARSLATGGLAKEINGLRNALVEAMAYLEARIDFPDEGDTQDTHLGDVYARVKKVDDRVGALLQTWDNGRVAAEGLKVALIGLPNAGKSTLLNALLKSDRAIVTAIAGTTRDYIEEKCMLNGRLFRLVDTAGIRDSDDQVEKIGIEQSIQISRDADIVVAMVGADTPPAEAEKIDVLVDGCDADVIKITTKSDLGLGIGWEGSVPISCYNSDGLDILKDLLVEAVDSHLNKLEDKVYITTERHRSALEETQISLKRFFDSYESGGFDECLAFELQEASRSLVSIIGVVGVEDILDKVFSQFCVGK